MHNTSTYPYPCTHTCTPLHACTHTRTHVRTHERTHARTHTHKKCTGTYLHMCTCTCTCTEGGSLSLEVGNVKEGGVEVEELEEVHLCDEAVLVIRARAMELCKVREQHKYLQWCMHDGTKLSFSINAAVYSLYIRVHSLCTRMLALILAEFPVSVLGVLLAHY